MKTVTGCDGIILGGVPGREDLRKLAAQGVKTLVDTREAGESPDPDVRLAALDLGLAFTHAPVSKDRVDMEQVERFQQVMFDPANHPVYAFSTGGKRPLGVLCFLTCARDGGSVVEVFRRARECGCSIDKEYALKSFILEYYAGNWRDILENHYRRPHPAKG